MKEHFFYLIATAIALSACGDGADQVGAQEPEAVTVNQKWAKDMCNCLKEFDWDKIDWSSQYDLDVITGFQKAGECNAEISQKYGVSADESSDSLRIELLARCPDVMKKIEGGMYGTSSR